MPLQDMHLKQRIETVADEQVRTADAAERASQTENWNQHRHLVSVGLEAAGAASQIENWNYV